MFFIAVDTIAAFNNNNTYVLLGLGLKGPYKVLSCTIIEGLTRKGALNTKAALQKTLPDALAFVPCGRFMRLRVTMASKQFFFFYEGDITCLHLPLHKLFFLTPTYFR